MSREPTALLLAAFLVTFVLTRSYTRLARVRGWGSASANGVHFQKTLGVNDYYYRSDDWEFPLGHIQMLGKSDREVIRAGAPLPAPGFALDYIADHAIDFWLTSEDLPHPDNRVTVDRNGRIHVAYTDRNTEGHRRLIGKLKGLLGHLGCHQTLIPNQLIRDARIPLAGIAHQCGTVRFGHDPESSGSTSTARRTTWTTCTSSTRASSRRPARSTRR